LGYIFNNNPVQIGFFRVDWSSWSQESPKSAASSRFKDLVQQARADQDMSPALVNLLKLLEDQEHYFARLMNILSNELAQVIKIPVGEIKYDRNISDLGIDSLMSAEFSRGLRAKYGLEATSMELLSGLSLEQLTENLVAQLTEKI
jgi:acyl carrier protein